VIKNELAGSGLPMNFKQFQWLVKNNIGTIITLREVPLPSEWFNTNYGDNNQKLKEKVNNSINYFHLYVEDYKSPTLDDLHKTIIYIENEVKTGRKVLVHCAAGKGRTGTILAAYILKKDNLRPEETIKKIRRLRPGSIQTKVQEETIHQYYYFLNSKESVKD
jgi:atypical dual specificity phosphatase